MILKEGRNINMDKDYAETYKEYKSGKYKYTKGFGKLGCYQGLDYIENILKNDKYYSEDLEDSFIFIQSYIKCIEQQVKNQKEIIDKLNNYIDNYDVFKVFSFPLMKKWEENQIKSSIDYEFKTSLIKDLKDILNDSYNILNQKIRKDSTNE